MRDLSLRLRPLTGALAAAAASGLGALVPAHALPLPANVDQRIVVIAPQETCGGGPGAWLVCGSSDTGTINLSANGNFGAQTLAQASSTRDSFTASLDARPGTNPNNPNSVWEVGRGVLAMVQFDDITVSGPAGPVQIGISARVVGAAEDRAGLSTGSWFLRIGTRNPTPAADLAIVDTWLLAPSPLYRFGTLWNTAVGPVVPSPDITTTGSMTVNANQTFELGTMFTIDLLSLKAWFTQVSWSFQVPAGYQLSSARGLAVNLPPVPEPGTWALMLAGLGVVGALGRRRA